MCTRPHPPSMPLLFGYDPEMDISSDHLARLVEQVVETFVAGGSHRPKRGRPAFDLRLCIKVLVFGYATGVRSSRQLERLCREHLAYLYLTRGDTPCYRTLCSVRVYQRKLLEEVWQGLFAVAAAHRIGRLGRIVVDSSKFRADASRDCVLTPGEYAAVLAELRRILAEADQTDQREEEEGSASETRLGQEVSTDQMRDIIRRVRSELARQKTDKTDSTVPDPAQESGAVVDTQRLVESAQIVAGVEAELGHPDDYVLEVEPTPPAPVVPTVGLGPRDRMRQRIKAGIAAIGSAIADGRTHLCLTDPDARMMPEGTEQKIRECHSFEIAVDNGLIVASQTTQVGSDQLRLGAIVEAAAKNEPAGIIAVGADSGYYSGDTVASLIASGIDTCIPDSHTACDLRRKVPIGTTRLKSFGTVLLTYVESANHYTCPEGNVLKFRKTQKKGGQMVSLYVAQRECTGCPLASQCLTQSRAKYRNLHVGQNHAVLDKARERFEQPEHQERYHDRGPSVETVFGFLRAVLGYRRWSLRGSEKTACEGSLFTIAYQVRKLLPAWQRSRMQATA
jgi:transposase